MRKYLDLSLIGIKEHTAYLNSVWASFLSSMGFKHNLLPDTCPMCYTVEDFCSEHPTGTYLLGTGTHVVAVKDGDYYDAWDSGDEVVTYYFAQN